MTKKEEQNVRRSISSASLLVYNKQYERALTMLRDAAIIIKKEIEIKKEV